MKAILTTLGIIIIIGALYLFIHNRNSSMTPSGEVAVSTSTNNGAGNGSGTPAPTGEIAILTPVSGSLVTSPIKLTGQAKGSWYFEATAPVFLTDAAGKVIAESHITAQGDWMTTNFVPFTGTLTFSATSTGTSTDGFVVFKNDNPSGLPANERTVKIPVRFR